MSENAILIDTDRNVVFDVLSDGWKYTNWVVGASHMRAVSANWPQVGAKLFHSSGLWPIMIRDETEVQSLEPGRRLVLRAKGRPLGSAIVDIEVSDEHGRCRVTMREEPVAGPGKWLHNSVTEALLHRRNEESLGRLAALCERRTEPTE
jgi:uncharacterized protein YndB with AHSA1/START domain